MLYENNKKKDLYIKAFGEFSIRYKDIAIGDYENRSHKVWTLIEYLLINRTEAVKQEKIYDVLWSDYEIGGQPANALKNLIYRARKALSELKTETELILFFRNTYIWNNEVNIIVDCEQFEKNIMQARVSEDPRRQIELYQNAIRLYTGDFLPKSSGTEWAMVKSAYYMNLYVECVKEICVLLSQKGDYKSVVNICEMGVMFYPLEESLNYELLQGYIKNKENAKALAHYTKISELFYSELGVSVSGSIKELYKEIVHSVNKVEMDISIINDNLQEAYCENGAYFCDYEVFKNIYRVQARSILRTDKTIQLALITLNHRPSVGEPKLNTKFVMGKLKKTILQSLRKGDTVASYSPVQFVILLPLTSQENCQTITWRIQDNFKRAYRKSNVTISVTTRSVTPNESLI